MATDSAQLSPQDMQWAAQNCSFIFQKYIEDKKDDKVDLASEITNVFKDLKSLFDLDDTEDLLKAATEKLPDDLFIDKQQFEHYLAQWCLQCKEENSSILISECLDIVDERFPEAVTDIEDALNAMTTSTNAEIEVKDLEAFLPQLMDILQVRIVKLDASRPKSDEYVCDSKDEAEFYADLAETAKRQSFLTLDQDKIEKLLTEYFSSLNCKF
jgi:RNA binding exosome subunit